MVIDMSLVSAYYYSFIIFDYSHMSRMHPSTPYCDVNCKAYLICAMKTSRSGDHSLCDNLPEGLTLQDIHLKLQEIQAC